MTQASRVIWFNEDDVSFVNVTTGHEYKSGETVTADSNDTSTTFKITLKDSTKHWPEGDRIFKFQQTDPENPVDPMYINGFQTTLYNDHFTFTSYALYAIFEYGGTSGSSSLDKENSFHFNALLDSNNNIIQDKDIVTNNPNVIAKSTYDVVYNKDHVTITAKSGFKITSVKMYTRLADGAKFADYTSSLDSKGNLDIQFDREPIPKGINAGLYSTSDNVWGYYAKVTTVPYSEPHTDENQKINFNVKYNNGLTDVSSTVTAEPKTKISGTVTAGAGYTITGVFGAKYLVRPGQYFYIKDFTATKISDYQYSYSFTAPSYKVDITIDVATKQEPGSILIDTSGLVNCYISPTKITQGKQTDITLNANPGYVLNGAGTYTVDGTTNSFSCNKVSSYQITITANKSVSISFKATKETKTETKPTSVIHTYVLDQDTYNNLGKRIVSEVNSAGDGFVNYNYTNFVNYLYEIPFDVGNDITTSSSSINFGKYNLDFSCKTVTHETLTVDLGSINLTDVATSNDMRPISIVLFAPFSENINLPTTVLGSKLYLSFSINLKNEHSLLLIKQNDNIIYSGQTELFNDLPLYFTSGTQDTLVRKLDKQYQNKIKQAYVLVNYNKPITGLTSYKTTEHGTLSNYKGFTRVSHGTLKRSISSSIDNALLSLLRQGVIIK